VLFVIHRGCAEMFGIEYNGIRAMLSDMRVF